MRFVSQAWWYVLPAILLAVPAFFVSPWATALLVGLAVAILLFFRDPERQSPPGGILSPADGKVTVIREEEDRLRVGVFMNIWDVHVNRAPVAGEVTAVDHRPGAHRPAFRKDSERNERVRIHLVTDEVFEVVLIAGAFARRITPYLEEGTRVARGERIGHIAFGSRVDVILPQGYDREDLVIERGERVSAGETVMVKEAWSGQSQNQG